MPIRINLRQFCINISAESNICNRKKNTNYSFVLNKLNVILMALYIRTHSVYKNFNYNFYF